MNYYTFNAIEALFWIALGLSGYALRNLANQKYRKLAIYALVVFITFGLSDITEILYGSFLEPGLLWLLVWKIINAAAVIYAIGWYISLRVRKEI